MNELSVVIRARNAAATLPACLESLRQQAFRDYEVILVDSGSTDATAALAEAFPARVVRIPPGRFSGGYASNTGFAAASGRHLCLLSPHCVLLGPHALGDLLAALRGADERVVAAYGEPVFGEAAAAAGPETVERIELGSFLQDPTRGLRNPFSIVRRQAWQELPFEEAGKTEDQRWAYHFLSRGGATLSVRPVRYRYRLPHGLRYYVWKNRTEMLELYAWMGKPDLLNRPASRYHVRQALDRLWSGQWRWRALADADKWLVAWAFGRLWASCRARGRFAPDAVFWAAAIREAGLHAVRRTAGRTGSGGAKPQGAVEARMGRDQARPSR